MITDRIGLHLVLLPLLIGSKSGNLNELIKSSSARGLPGLGGGGGGVGGNDEALIDAYLLIVYISL